MLLVADLMSPEPIYVRPETSLPECGRFLHVHRIRHLPVIGEEGSVLGIVLDSAVWSHGATTDRQGRLDWIWHVHGDRGATAADLLEPAEVLVPPEIDVSALARHWCATSLQDAALVTEGDHKLVGIVTEHDMARAAAGGLSRTHLVGARGALRQPLVVDVNTPVRSALEQLRQRKARHLLVASGDAVVGVLSLRDLVELQALDIDLVTPGGPIWTVPEHTSLRAVAAVMVRHRVGFVPVIDRSGALAGVVSRRDLMDALIHAEEDEHRSARPEPH